MIISHNSYARAMTSAILSYVRRGPRVWFQVHFVPWLQTTVPVLPHFKPRKQRSGPERVPGFHENPPNSTGPIARNINWLYLHCAMDHLEPTIIPPNRFQNRQRIHKGFRNRNLMAVTLFTWIKHAWTYQINKTKFAVITQKMATEICLHVTTFGNLFWPPPLFFFSLQ